MLSLGRLGLVLSIAGAAVAAHAAPDSPPLPAEDLNAGQMARDVPMQPEGLPPRGGWSRDGWSDTATSDRRPDRDRAIAPRGPRPGAQTDRGNARSGEWRRQTWDGGRGEPFAYRRGGRLPAIFVSPRYAVPDWREYGLLPPGPGRRWVRYYDDAVLIDGGGTVIDAVPAIGWDDLGPGPDRGWYGGGGMAWHPEAPRIDHRGPGPAPQVHYGADGSTTIVITTAPSVATTTTTTSYVTTRKRAWTSRPNKLVQTKPRRAMQTKPAR